jgi:hypothetical protein
MVMDLRPSCEVAQPFCDDVVVAAAWFRPNAPGRWELSSFSALGERQLLKSRAAYFAERILVAVTPVEVVAIAMDATAIFRNRLRVWPRSELAVQLIPSRVDRHAPAGDAVQLSRRGWFPHLEVAPMADDRESWAVLDQLFGGLCFHHRV